MCSGTPFCVVPTLWQLRLAAGFSAENSSHSKCLFLPFGDGVTATWAESHKKKLKSAPWFRIVTEPAICVLPRFSAIDPFGQGTGEDFVLMYVESRDVKIQPLGSNTNTWCEARRPPELVKHGMASPFMTLFVFIADGFFNFPPKTDTAQKVHKKKLQ